MEDIQSSTNDFEILNDMDEQEQVSQESQNADEEDSPSSNEQLVGFEWKIRSIWVNDILVQHWHNTDWASIERRMMHYLNYVLTKILKLWFKLCQIFLIACKLSLHRYHVALKLQFDSLNYPDHFNSNNSC